MKEIGGFIEFEHFQGRMMHESALALNCGRNCLLYLIQARQIKNIVLPYFMCDSVIRVCRQSDVQIRFYHIDEHFLPQNIDLKENEWLYLTDFYGQLSKKDIQQICNTHQRVIVDYVQAYFKEPLDGVDSIYTCRKFFGVPDGAFLYTDVKVDENLPQDESFERMHFLLGRYEHTASEFYEEYRKNDELFDHAPIMRMSKLTENLLRAIDYERVKNIRTANFNYLERKLGHINMLRLNHAEGAFAYPLLLEDGAKIRKKLIENKIYTPTLWPNILEELSENMYEYYLTKNILPLPCDQRYDEDDMEYICQHIIYD